MGLRKKEGVSGAEKSFPDGFCSDVRELRGPFFRGHDPSDICVRCSERGGGGARKIRVEEQRGERGQENGTESADKVSATLIW